MKVDNWTAQMEVKQFARDVAAASVALRQHARQFLSWWGGELLTLLPQQLRDMMQRQSRRLIVNVDGKSATFTLHRPQGARRILDMVFAQGAEAQPWAADVIKKACLGHVDEIVVRIPLKQALRKTLTLPIAAEENLREVLGFEMDRHSPFKAGQVYYDFAVIARDPVKHTLRVELTVVPRSEFEPLLEMLTSWGLEPTSMDVADGDASDEDAVETTGLNLIPAQHRRMPRGRNSRQNAILAMIAAVLLVIAIVLPFVQKMNVVTGLEAKVEQAKQEAREAEQVRTELEQLVSEVNVLANKRKERPTVVQVLDELTRLLPDSTWLSRFEVSEMRVKIRGESSNAANLATLMENSELFKDASFDSPVTRDLQTEQERFVLSATVVKVNAND